jgi:sulfite exporter TauE/SafE
MELWTAFMLGFAGSLHCAGMCGPLVLAMPATPGHALNHLTNKLAYNAGRLLTYGALGLVFGGFGRWLGLDGFQRWVSLSLGVLVLLSLLAWPARQTNLFLARPIGWLKQALGGLLLKSGPGAQFLFGSLNGLLPCGLVYMAAFAATTSGHAWDGFSYMIFFGLGTVPMMLGLALAGRSLHFKFQPHLRRFTPVCFGVMAALLILRGLGLGIPYLSPHLDSTSPDHSICCQPVG